jgi:hypothetical protein
LALEVAMWSGSSDHQNETAGFEPAVSGSVCFASASVAQVRVVELPLERLRVWDGKPRTIRRERLEELKQAMLADREMLSAVVWTHPPYGVEYVGKAPRRLRITNDLDGTAGALLEAALRAADSYEEYHDGR